ncbi:conserved hypothetical protein [Solidesulfovibrio fructosivorans JJ]]|uniref:CHAT domain-containing protein n=1 Tax=Solidesulfovibrio fructosivorans JJ] TaxID=596151 RepID=E1JXF6_SOLFR|nr:CHAT domain-containing protein [Solidesulfovibrio fructosivorans]EFL50933.1 conserved hypothetical protein [Solidesulfovibrio fructosivorans JJ]]
MPLELMIAGQHITLLAGGKTYPPRQLDETAVAALSGFAASYSDLVPKENNRDGLLALGRRLFEWLDGDDRRLRTSLEQYQPPCVLEVICSSHKPNAAESAVLDAPWEILADDSGFLAESFSLGFSPVRRVQRAQKPNLADNLRLGLVFMAASPRGADMLDYEAEEAAILQAVGEQRIDLVVEESGELDQLGHKLAALQPMTVLHLSCHGSNEPYPLLALEDEKGDCKPAKASDLALTLRATTPRLLFLSACLTSALPGQSETGPAQSLAAELARAGQPAVLGWNGSVGDSAATLFATELYKSLSDGHPLEDALFVARFRLLENTELKRNDWHLARLWVGERGGGVLVGGTKERSLLPATHGHKELLGKKQDVPVAAHEMFVGRRRELKEGLRVLAGQDNAGLLLLGMGRLGKSSLAARLANRRPDLALAVVHGEFGGALAILQALEEALGDSPDARRIIASAKATVAREPESLGEVLQQLLCGDNAPCCKDKPVLLVLDDLEQILDAPADDLSPHRVKTAYSGILQALLTACNPNLTKSRLLFTSRFAFGLGGLETKLHSIQLAAFKTKEQHKLLLHQRNAATMAEAEEAARGILAKRALAASRGNPGLQDLLVGKFVLKADVPVAKAESALDQMEAYLDGGKLPEQEEMRLFLENLAVQTLLDLAGDCGRALLRAAMLFKTPVPEAIIAILAKAVGGNVGHLRGLGLLEPYEDLANPAVTALAGNALATARIDPLQEAEARLLVKLVLEPLFQAWGSEDRNNTPVPTDIELFRLGLLAGNAPIVAACSRGAMAGLIHKVGNLATAQMGQAALALCQEKAIETPVILLRRTAQACFAAGQVDNAKALLSQLEKQLEHTLIHGERVSISDMMAPYFEYGNILLQQGNLTEAEVKYRHMYTLANDASMDREKAIALIQITSILIARRQYDEALNNIQHQALPIFEKHRDTRSIAACYGQIADIYEANNQLKDAMDIRQQQQLPIYTKFDDSREISLCLGKIANIKVAFCQLDEAMKLQIKRLKINRKLNDKIGISASLWSIAKILLEKDQKKAVLYIISKAYKIATDMGTTDGIATIGYTLGELLVRGGKHEEGIDVLQRSIAGFRHLGREEEAQKTEALLAQARKFIADIPKED